MPNIGACNTAGSPYKINPTDEANAPLVSAVTSATVLTTRSWYEGAEEEWSI
jgi:hypothetical protein